MRGTQSREDAQTTTTTESSILRLIDARRSRKLRRIHPVIAHLRRMRMTRFVSFASSIVNSYLFVCEKMKNALPFGIGFLSFFTLISLIRRGRAVIFSFTDSSSSSSSSSSSKVHICEWIFNSGWGM